jgi:drug/metabolite transporter (DMT)-like permease
LSAAGQLPVEVLSPAPQPRGPGRAWLYPLLWLMILSWGLNFVVGKIALREIPPLVVASLRTVIAGVFILPVFLWSNRGRRRSFPARDVAALLVLGVGLAVGNQILFVVGLSRTSVAHAAVAVALSPITALVIAAIAGQERITGRKVVGMLIAFSGIIALQIGRNGGRGPTLAGDLILLLSGSMFAAYAVFGKALTARYGSLTANTFAYTGGAVIMLPVSFWLLGTFDASRVSIAAWAAVTYMAVFSAVIAYLILYYALQWMPASRVSAFSHLQPPLAAGSAALILGERPTAGFAVACVLVLAGVFLTERG